jgi:hypothetical protein
VYVCFAVVSSFVDFVFEDLEPPKCVLYKRWSMRARPGEHASMHDDTFIDVCRCIVCMLYR